MPFWPIYLVASVGLTIWGAYRGAWLMPALAAVGFVATRFVIEYAPNVAHEVTIANLWLIIAAIMVYKGGAVPGFFFALSALTYPAFLIFGYHIERMGVIPIIADGFAVLALLAIGGGLRGMADSSLDRGGILPWLAHHSLGVALR